jgi:hypothetical protein
MSTAHDDELARLTAEREALRAWLRERGIALERRPWLPGGEVPRLLAQRLPRPRRREDVS